MGTELIVSFVGLFIQQLFIVQTYAIDLCLYNINSTANGVVQCVDQCCTSVATSAQTACCSSISWSTLAIPFFIIAGVCVFAFCCAYLRPLWKAFLCNCKCPFNNRSRVSSPGVVAPNENPVYVVNNDDLPDYETIVKDAPHIKDITPPPYNFVTTHANEFGIERIASAPPQYRSRHGSLASVSPIPPVVVDS